MRERNISELMGKTLTQIVNTTDEIVFTTNAGEKFKLYHEQDCCETVEVEDINGELDDLIGAPIFQPWSENQLRELCGRVAYVDVLQAGDGEGIRNDPLVRAL